MGGGRGVRSSVTKYLKKKGSPMSNVIFFHYFLNTVILGYHGLGYNKQKILYVCIIEQAWATSGPRATYDPPSILMWSAITVYTSV